MNKKVHFSLIVLLLPALACSFAGVGPSRVVESGKVTSETRQVSGFNSVELRGSADVSVTQGGVAARPSQAVRPNVAIKTKQSIESKSRA